MTRMQTRIREMSQEEISQQKRKMETEKVIRQSRRRKRYLRYAL